MQAAWVMANLTEGRKALINELAAACCPNHVRPENPGCTCGYDQMQDVTSALRTGFLNLANIMEITDDC